MRNIRFALVAVGLAFLFSGCGSGIIYTHTVVPLSLDMQQTEVVQTKGTGNIKHIQVSYVGTAWDSVAFGDIAKKNGLNELYFADLETLKVLGIWNQYTVHLYGK
jgi:hypothetical protein